MVNNSTATPHHVDIPLPISIRDVLLTPRVAAAVLACVIVAQAFTTYRDATELSRIVDELAGPVIVQPSGARRGDPGTEVITAANLFGQPAPSADDMQLSQAGLVLSGVLAMDDPGAGLAILGTDPASVAMYSVGSFVDGSARLWRVYARYVVLERNGRYEQLELSRPASNAATASLLMPPEESAEGGRRVVAVIPEGDDPPAAVITVDNPYGLPPDPVGNRAPAARIAAVAPGDDPPAVPIRVDNPDGLKL